MKHGVDGDRCRRLLVENGERKAMHQQAASPSPARRPSYHARASAISNSASGAVTSSTGLVDTHLAFHLFPSQSRPRIFCQVRFSVSQFLPFPVVNRHRARLGRKVVP